MNRVLCVVKAGPVDKKIKNTAPDVFIGETYTVATVTHSRQLPDWLRPLHGNFYTLWECGEYHYYHESLFAALSDDYDTERITADIDIEKLERERDKVLQTWADTSKKIKRWLR